MDVNKKATETMSNVSLPKTIIEDFDESLPVKWFIISFIIVITLLSLFYYINSTDHLHLKIFLIIYYMKKYIFVLCPPYQGSTIIINFE